MIELIRNMYPQFLQKTGVTGMTWDPRPTTRLPPSYSRSSNVCPTDQEVCAHIGHSFELVQCAFSHSIAVLMY